MKNIKIKSIYFLYFMVLPAFMITITSCNSHKGHTMKKKKLKRGRPIPCPVKDC
ncbi:hypothetical protein ACE193_03655 [Bernardetia sp. OM2101]|uniref:hypothetical protein n=1 Tax=Bernardetia sp. OM2101 TaxID=3344876 RepID=UPI0035D07EC7